MVTVFIRYSLTAALLGLDLFDRRGLYLVMCCRVGVSSVGRSLKLIGRGCCSSTGGGVTGGGGGGVGERGGGSRSSTQTSSNTLHRSKPSSDTHTDNHQ